MAAGRHSEPNHLHLAAAAADAAAVVPASDVGTAVVLPYMAVAGVGLRPGGGPTAKLVGTAGEKEAIAGEALVQIVGEALVQMVEPNPAGGLATGPLLVKHRVPSFDLIQHSFAAGGLVEGQDVEEPCVLLVAGLGPGWMDLDGSLASSEASWQLVGQLTG